MIKKEPVSFPCDVYSYGMILFEMFTGQRPFSGSDYVEVITMVCEGEVCMTLELASISVTGAEKRDL